MQELLGEALVGERSRQALELGKFPLLIKILDANRWLSIQVHPDDDYGLRHEGEFGKTEMWVVLHAEPGAELIYGFSPASPATPTPPSSARRQSVSAAPPRGRAPGDVIFVPAGTIHALGPGVMVAEIQQNSDTTYRIWDWGRPRPLHLQQSLDVLNFDLVEPARAVQPTCSWTRTACASSGWRAALTSRPSASPCRPATSSSASATARPLRSGR